MGLPLAARLFWFHEESWKELGLTFFFGYGIIVTVMKEPPKPRSNPVSRLAKLRESTKHGMAHLVECELEELVDEIREEVKREQPKLTQAQQDLVNMLALQTMSHLQQNAVQLITQFTLAAEILLHKTTTEIVEDPDFMEKLKKALTK